MTALIIVVFALFACLAKALIEFRRRWRANYEFLANAHAGNIVWTWPGARAGQYRRLTLRSASGSDFVSLVGFRLGNNLVDFYGYVKSHEGKITLETWVKAPKTFIFLLENGVDITVDDSTPTGEPPDYKFPPHWWQRLGFFA